MSKLMTKELEKSLPIRYSQEHKNPENMLVRAHYFTTFGNWDWYVVEYDPEEKLFFGLVKGFNIELGYFSLEEFEHVNRIRSVPQIERDRWWEPISLAELKKQLKVA